MGPPQSSSSSIFFIRRPLRFPLALRSAVLSALPFPTSDAQRIEDENDDDRFGKGLNRKASLETNKKTGWASIVHCFQGLVRRVKRGILSADAATPAPHRDNAMGNVG